LTIKSTAAKQPNPVLPQASLPSPGPTNL